MNSRPATGLPEIVLTIENPLVRFAQNLNILSLADLFQICRGNFDFLKHKRVLDTDDPHAWLSPDDMAKTVPLIVNALGERRPELAGTFAKRGEELRKSLADMSARIHAMLDGAGTKTFLTFHQSWAHYARNFGLREVSVELEGREPGPKGMAMLMDFAKANNIKAVVADSLTSRAAVEAIAKNLEATVIYATPLAEDWPGALLEFSEKLAGVLGGSPLPHAARTP